MPKQRGRDTITEPFPYEVQGKKILESSLAVVMKDDSGGMGHVHKRMDPEKFLPTKVRITMVQVAKGAKYDPKLVEKLIEKK